MENFQDFRLPEALSHTLAHMQFTTPTPIQVQAIPPALEGRDILGSAQTGTGKTGAFGIPLVAKLMLDETAHVLVMTPTRELAAQVLTQLQAMLGKRSSIKTALLIGGDPMPKQLQQLKMRPRLIVGTPGRINDHLNRKSLNLSSFGFLVLDETDRMLDMGFTVQIETIIAEMNPVRQTLLFSATLPKNIVRIANDYLNEPVRVAVDAASSPAKNISHEVVFVPDQEVKYTELLNQLHAREGSVILFVKTKYGTEKMAKRLVKDGHSANAIHGDLRQTKRDKVIAQFRNKKHRILVATDVAARGLDIPHIEHVINFDLPQVAEDYIHRIGRTARAGAEGAALCFVSPEDRRKWSFVQELIDPEAAEKARAERRAARENGEKKPRHKKTFKGLNADRSQGGKPRRKFGFNPFEGEEQTQEPKRAEGKRFSGKKEDRGFEPRAFEGRNEGRKEGRSQDGRKFEGRKDGKPRFEGDKPQRERRAYDPMGGDAASFEGRKFEGKKDAGPRAESFKKGKPAFAKGRSAKADGRGKPAFGGRPHAGKGPKPGGKQRAA